ncbi:MAG: Benzoate transport protein, partial [uncultured Friedmanniella sp.]
AGRRGDRRGGVRLLLRPGADRADRLGRDHGPGCVGPAGAAGGHGGRHRGADPAVPDPAHAGLVHPGRGAARRRGRGRSRVVGGRRHLPAGRRADRADGLVAVAVPDAGVDPAVSGQRDAGRGTAADLRDRLHHARPDAAVHRPDPADLGARLRVRPPLGRAAGPAGRAGGRRAHPGRDPHRRGPGPAAHLDRADVRLAAAARAGHPAVLRQHRLPVRARGGGDEDLRLHRPLAADDAGHRRRVRAGGAGRRLRGEPGRDLRGAVRLTGGPPGPAAALGRGHRGGRQLPHPRPAVRRRRLRADALPARPGGHRGRAGPARPARLGARALPGRSRGPGGRRRRPGRHRVGPQPVRHRRRVLGPGLRTPGPDPAARGPGPSAPSL